MTFEEIVKGLHDHYRPASSTTFWVSHLLPQMDGVGAENLLKHASYFYSRERPLRVDVPAYIPDGSDQVNKYKRELLKKFPGMSFRKDGMRGWITGFVDINRAEITAHLRTFNKRVMLTIQASPAGESYTGSGDSVQEAVDALRCELQVVMDYATRCLALLEGK